MSGDCTESVVLLHLLADKYRALGQAHVAAGLIRRAVLHIADPVSGAHTDAILRARMALAEILAESGAVEDAITQYRAVTAAKAPAGVQMSLSLKDAVKATRHAAAAAAAMLLTRLGREAEAQHVLTVYGGGARA